MGPLTARSFRHVQHRWDEQRASALAADGLGRLVYRSNLLGADGRITNTGGGNTSSKLTERDPVSGRAVEVLWVKGSGGDLGTATAATFASLDIGRLRDLKGVYAGLSPRGPKTAAEDRMVDLYGHCAFGRGTAPPSIDTALHAFVPFRCVDHTHPNAVIAIAAAARTRELTDEVFGDDVGWLPWQRPGFELGLSLARLCEERPGLKGAVLAGHGLINWADDDRTCYETTLALIERAAEYVEAHDRGPDTFGGQRFARLPDDERESILYDLLPWLRGELSKSGRLIATVQCDERVLAFVNSHDAPRLAALGTSCPDHFLRTKIKPLYVECDPSRGDADALRSACADGLARYAEEYRDYYERFRRPDSPPMRSPFPTVVLMPGIGMIAWGKSRAESRITAEFYSCAVEVMRGAEAIDEYVALPLQEAFDIEYWALEEAKLRRQPPEKALARHVVAVIGAGHGIGRAAAERLAAEGAHVACADLDAAAAADAARACGPSIDCGVNTSDRASVQAMLRRIVLAYGGLDDIVVTAGVYAAADESGRVSDAQWRRTFDVNVFGAYVVADEAEALWKRQGLTGSLVLTTSVNAVVPKPGSLAYDTSKAATSHLVRELAVRLAPLVRVNGVAPATVVGGSTMFSRERVIASLQRYGLPCEEGEDTDSLRERLARFYAGRSLLKVEVRVEDQAEAIAFLVSERASRTTGQILTVDGGLPEAFLR